MQLPLQQRRAPHPLDLHAMSPDLFHLCLGSGIRAIFSGFSCKYFKALNVLRHGQGKRLARHDVVAVVALQAAKACDPATRQGLAASPSRPSRQRAELLHHARAAPLFEPPRL